MYCKVNLSVNNGIPWPLREKIEYGIDYWGMTMLKTQRDSADLLSISWATMNYRERFDVTNLSLHCHFLVSLFQSFYSWEGHGNPLVSVNKWNPIVERRRGGQLRWFENNNVQRTRKGLAAVPVFLCIVIFEPIFFAMPFSFFAIRRSPFCSSKIL